LDAITRALTSTFRLVPALWAEIEDQERRLFRFTEDQLNVLKLLQSHPRAAIQGVAGSGKTVLALSKARAFADEGKRVLFVCFNELLASWLRSQLPDVYKNAITILNYHKLCSEWVKAASMTWPIVADEPEFFRSDAAQLLEQAIDFRQDLCFDAVVVDEGQDFQPSWWDTIELLNKRPTEGPLYVFYDPDQQIFNDSIGSMPDLGEPFFLPVNCRNTERIAARCGSIIGKDIPVNHGTPSGRSPRFIHSPTKADQSRAVEQQVSDWVSNSGGLRPDHIAIVTRGKAESSSVSNLRTIAGVPVVDDLASWKGGAGVLLTSLYRFKGLEADALILVDVDRPDPNAAPPGFRPEHFYVGCSRAKHLLTIISRSDGWFV
jgi:superfamily I DNA and RNA helicase